MKPARPAKSAPATPPRPVTLVDWLAYSVARYNEAGVALGQTAVDAHDEALYLLLRTLNIPLESDETVLAHRLTPAEVTAVETMLHRRIVERVPAAYLMREAFLGEHRFYVDERVIIPRSYFLELIEGELNDFLPSPDDPTQVRRAVDVCTGGGSLAILLAHHFSAATVDALDLSADALEVARINVRDHGLTGRITLHRSDVFDAVPAVPYDIILSNPPYEPSAHVDAQEPEFKAEPRMAHDGGPDGLVIVRKLLRQARERLAPEGIVTIEVGALRKAMNREFAALKPVWMETEDDSNCVCVIRAADIRAWVR